MTDYPRMMYHEDGRTMPVNNEEAETKMGAEWSRNPSDIHRLGRSGNGVVAPVQVSGTDDLIDRFIARMREEFYPDTMPKDGEQAPKRASGRPPGRSGTYPIEDEKDER